MKASSHHPKWLYEALPYVYAVAALVVIASLRNAIALASGALLLSAAALVAYMRIEYRHLRVIERGCSVTRRSTVGQLPAWLYEALPFIYTIAGVATLVGLPNLPGILASALLISASGVVLAMRRRHRRALRYLRKRAAEQTEMTQVAPARACSQELGQGPRSAFRTDRPAPS